MSFYLVVFNFSQSSDLRSANTYTYFLIPTYPLIFLGFVVLIVSTSQSDTAQLLSVIVSAQHLDWNKHKQGLFGSTVELLENEDEGGGNKRDPWSGATGQSPLFCSGRH